MTTPRTAAERYLAERLQDPEYRAAYESVRDRIARIDAMIRAFDARREELALTKAELARRAGIQPEAVRRLFSSERQNPTLTTVLALADALELDVVPVPRAVPTGKSRPTGRTATSRSGTAGTPQRTA
jgi:DNA-binding phage protein